MKQIPLESPFEEFQGKFATVDDDNFDWLSEMNWFALPIEGHVHAATIINDEVVLMEHLVLQKAEKAIRGELN